MLACVFFMVAGLFFSGCETTDTNPTGPDKAGTASQVNILMSGRSIMQGWFSHWGSDGSRAVPHDPYMLYYGALWSPPDIIDSLQWQLNNVVKGNGWTIFFKLCFADFDGSSPESAAENLARNTGYLEKAFNLVVSGKGLPIIFATALPKVRASTTEGLVWNHRAYNQRIKNMAAAHPGEIYVFDIYSILADSEGSLRADYAASPTDSHLNARAYAALDAVFFAMLDETDLSSSTSKRLQMNKKKPQPPLRR